LAVHLVHRQPRDIYCRSDFREFHVQLKLNLRTRNRVGTVFGGSIYSSVDPYFMLLLMEVLGKNFVVWDKAASVKFVRPYHRLGEMQIRDFTDETVEEIKRQIDDRGEYTFDLAFGLCRRQRQSVCYVQQDYLRG
jgi:hypothetical protein